MAIFSYAILLKNKHFSKIEVHFDKVYLLNDLRCTDLELVLNEKKFKNLQNQLNKKKLKYFFLSLPLTNKREQFFFYLRSNDDNKNWLSFLMGIQSESTTPAAASAPHVANVVEFIWMSITRKTPLYLLKSIPRQKSTWTVKSRFNRFQEASKFCLL